MYVESAGSDQIGHGGDHVHMNMVALLDFGGVSQITGWASIGNRLRSSKSNAGDGVVPLVAQGEGLRIASRLAVERT
jgi:hypothetical protein